MYLDDCVCVLPDLTWLPLLGVGRKSWYIIIIIAHLFSRIKEYFTKIWIQAPVVVKFHNVEIRCCKTFRVSGCEIKQRSIDLLLKQTSLIPSNTLSSRSLNRDTEWRIKWFHQLFSIEWFIYYYHQMVYKLLSSNGFIKLFKQMVSSNGFLI